MDAFVNADASQWVDLWEGLEHVRRNPLEDREHFDSLVLEHARLCSNGRSDTTTAASDLKLLGLTRCFGPAAAVQALNTLLLLVPKCDLSMNLHLDVMFCVVACSHLA